MRYALAFLLFSLVLSPAMGSMAFANQIEPGDEELLRTLIAHQDAAQKAMRSYVLEQEWTLEKAYVYRPGEPPHTPKEDIRTQCSMRMVRDGDHYFLTRDDYLETVSESWSERRHYQCVLNAKYFAEYNREQGNFINVWEHESIETMRDSPRDSATTWYPKPFALDFAFGDSEMSMSQHYGLDQANSRWSVENAEIDGDPVYKVTARTRMDAGREKVMHYFIDPNRGFLQRGQDYFSKDGKLGSSTRVTLDRIDGIWFPRHIVKKDLDAAPKTLEIRITNYVVKSTDSDEKFTIASMKFLPDAYMQRISTSGLVLSYRYRDGSWASER